MGHSQTSAMPTNPSLHSSQDDATSGGIGLSDPKYCFDRQRMLELIQKLHETGVQQDINLPMIAAIGSQSAGKSSLIERISGITLPRASGTCTRAPIECRLIHSPGPWKCVVKLRFSVSQQHGRDLKRVRNVDFGEIHDKSLVEERIRRAQRAILNPSANALDFLRGPDEDPPQREYSFSSNCISLVIGGPDMADLSFCDLPGLIVSVSHKEDEKDIDLVKQLVQKYISNPSCIILLTVTCETDLENQGAYLLAKTHDPDGQRTIGVLTKPDRAAPGEEHRWMGTLKTEGWYCVKQPDSQELQARISRGEIDEREESFFSCAPWSSLELSHKQRLRTRMLVGKLSDTLSALVSEKRPKLLRSIQHLVRTTEAELEALPDPPSSDAFSEILHIISNFSRDLTRYLEGTPGQGGLLQTIKPAVEKFKYTVRDTAPDFRPYTRQTYAQLPPKPRPNANMSSSDGEDGGDNILAETHLSFDFLPLDETPTYIGDDKHAIFVDEVMQNAKSAITRELPDFYPFAAVKEYILSLTRRWSTPARDLVDKVHDILLVHVKVIVSKHFDKYSHGGLQHQVMLIVTNFIKECCTRTAERIQLWLLDLEMQPQTMNNHYYSDYRDKFLAYYRGCRIKSDHSGVLSSLEAYNTASIVSVSSPKLPKSLVERSNRASRIKDVLSGLDDIGIPNVKAIDLMKLLPSDEYDPALNIMASVRAYFQVAYKRFVDNVPMTIDHGLVLALDRDGALEKAIRIGLGIGTGPDTFQRCKDFLQESPNMAARRDRIQGKLDRLNAAKTEILGV